ncbi:MAG TPA: C25 family cysteine peptidase [Fluviicola sp.]|nr:C25 family cysteine peptidase [Fluviicola sp.]
MIKRYLQLLLVLIISSASFAQNYGNEWINFSQKYFSFKIHTTGIQRIDYAALAASNVPVGTFSSENIQVFGREKEVPLYIVDGNDNSLDPGDYILFYAEKNDGWLDSLVYETPADIANPGFSMYNDTIQYFFTWNSSTNNARFVVDTDTDFAGYGAPVNYVLKEVASDCPVADIGYSEGFRYGDASGSIYAPGEGWACGTVSLGGGYNVYAPTNNVYTGPGAPLCDIQLKVASNSNAAANPDHHLRMSIGSSAYTLVDSTFEGFQFHQYDLTFSPGILNTPTSNLVMQSINDLGSAADLLSLTFWRLRYPKTPAAAGAAFDNFYVENNANASKSLVNLQALTASNPVAFSFGSTNRVLPLSFDGSNWQMLVTNNASGNLSYVTIGDITNAHSVTTLSAVNGSGQFTDFSALSTEEAVLMVYHPALQGASANYANYRSSLAGGGNNVVMANVHELYQQYGGGIEKHVIAIRRFALHAYDLASVTKPAALFLVGKGIAEHDSRKDPSVFAQSLIPSFGYPSSDIAITSGLHGTHWDPLIPTGRIAVRTNNELQDYLDKVVLYESQQVQNDPSNYNTPAKDWQKQILHFVGGSNASQQGLFRGYMDGMKDIIEDSVYAGNVTSYYKTTSDPLDPTVIAGVNSRISSGVSLMNFFGHAAASNNGFEVNIDEPANWDNYGKYPVVIGNSCYNGNIFAEGNSTSERFVNIADAGAIAFISSVSVGYAQNLDHYSNHFYREFSYINYGATIGEQMRRTIQYVQTSIIQEDLISETTCQQMTLNGDPMLRMNWHERPEIEITPQSLYFEPSTLNLTVDSIELNLIITNLGQSVTDTFNVEIIRDFPGSFTDSIYNIPLPFLHYKDTIHLKMPMQPNIGVGINKFKISVDLPSYIAEQAEEVTNNQLNYDFFINVDGILPVYPYNFAVVPYDSVTVRASTINPIASLKTYHFELDTVDTYDSPQLRRHSLTELGGVKEVGPTEWTDVNGSPFPLVCTDSTVYFWRVAVDSSVLNWTEYSFQYIPGKTGWGQDHFFQFKNNDFYSIEYDRPDRLLKFDTASPRTIYIRAFDNPTVYNQWGINGEYLEYAAIFGGAPALYVAVIDPVTFVPWGTRYGASNPTHNFGNGNDNGSQRPRVEKYFAFNQSDPAQLAAFENMVENEIPDGHYVAIYSAVSTEYHLWDVYQPSLYQTFTDLGSTLVNNSQPEKPFGMIFKKGDPSSLVEKHFPDTIADTQIGNHIYVEKEFDALGILGVEKTPMIGPSLDWNTIYWKRDSLEMAQADSVRIKIEAFDINQVSGLLIDQSFTPNDSIMNLNSLIDASLYPYIRLEVFIQDSIYFTPAQIDRLHVLYQPVPEAAIDGTSAYYWNPLVDTLQEGQQASFAVDVRNISDFDMDSLLVNYWVEDANRVKHPIDYPRQEPLLVNGLIRDKIQFSTVNLAGQNSLWMEVNPYVNGSVYVTDQPEQHHFNNLLQIPFKVAADDEQPVLDVTFDGKHILNGDIIDPESEILITLKDDNPFLVMNDVSDTTLFGIYLTDPNGIQRRVPFMDGSGNIVMQWIPADVQNKKFKIIYPAMFDMDGTYSLIVQGTDRSGNISGDIEYRISFEIVHESSITYLMNYPNPFSTSTRFVFTLTGTEEPEEMIIQIMTVTGRVVREITEDEIGPISIGRNITEYAWDGTDEFGDPLANGVYLYRVKAKINGEDIKHRETDADAHFKKEFGKMYLMR